MVLRFTKEELKCCKSYNSGPVSQLILIVKAGIQWLHNKRYLEKASS